MDHDVSGDISPPGSLSDMKNGENTTFGWYVREGYVHFFHQQQIVGGLSGMARLEIAVSQAEPDDIILMVNAISAQTWVRFDREQFEHLRALISYVAIKLRGG